MTSERRREKSFREPTGWEKRPLRQMGHRGRKGTASLEVRRGLCLSLHFPPGSRWPTAGLAAIRFLRNFSQVEHPIRPFRRDVQGRGTNALERA